MGKKSTLLIEIKIVRIVKFEVLLLDMKRGLPRELSTRRFEVEEGWFNERRFREVEVGFVGVEMLKTKLSLKGFFLIVSGDKIIESRISR